MGYFGIYFRLSLMLFIVITLINVKQINTTKLFPLNEEQRHAWNNNPTAAGLLKTITQQQQQPNPQQQLLQANDNVGDVIASSVLRFALNVGSKLSENAYFSKSEVFSPLSIMSALALLLAGAKGKSYQQLTPIFGFDVTQSPNYAQMLHEEFGLLLQDIEQGSIGTMHRRQNAKWRDTPAGYNIRGMSQNQKPITHIVKVANGIFTQTGFSIKPNYKDVLTTIYRAEAMELDFLNNGEAARQYINGWVSKNTYGKIPSIINNAIPQSTNMILASVLYFKAFWENTFFEAATALDNFYPEGEGKPAIKVPMMATGGIFPYYETSDLRIIGLPYRGNLTTMYVIQPKQSSRAQLKDMQNRITPEMIEDMISKMAYRTAVMAFPKLHLVRQLNLKEILQQFGVTDIFSSSLSDLSLIGSGSGAPTSRPYEQTAAAFNVPSRHVPSRPLAVQHAKRPELMDRYNEAPLFFSSRFGEIGNGNATMLNETKQESTTKKAAETPTTTLATNDVETVTTTIKDEEVLTTTTTPIPTISKNQTVTNSRKKRNNSPLSLLEAERLQPTQIKSDLYVEDIFHKVDFEVNEQGTEAAAATLTYLRRSGTDVVFRADTPFMLLLRHDPSKLVLFYAFVNEPEI